MKGIKAGKDGFFHRNGLSLVLLFLMLACWTGQALTGWHENNDELRNAGLAMIGLWNYLHSDHFWTATAENWESEFLQMGMYVLLTVRLFQRGSSESKKLDEEEEVDREPRPSAGSPWPVQKGGVVLLLYKHSLSLAFLLLFVLSFTLHFNSSWAEYNDERVRDGLPLIARSDYLGMSHFWFESFQNWQSEFLAVLSIVFLSIYLREQGSPESKPVDASHYETGSS